MVKFISNMEEKQAFVNELFIGIILIWGRMKHGELYMYVCVFSRRAQRERAGTLGLRVHHY